MTQVSLAALVAREMERHGRSLFDQRFSPEVEARFELDTRAAFVAHMRRCCMIGLGCFVFFTLDTFLLPDMLTDQLIQDGFAVPVIGALALGVGRVRSRRLLNMLACTIIVVSTSLSAIVPAAIEPQLAGANALTNIGFIVFANVTVRLDFDQAVLASVAGAVVIFTMVLGPGISTGEVVLVMTTTVCVAIFTLFANHQLIDKERRAYLVSLQERLCTAALAADNSSLFEISNSDPLTRAVNRRGFDTALAAAFEDNSGSGGEVALLMIDLDHFKRFNDRYGHPAGDECLRSLVAAMRFQLRDGRDLLARYGGEEFCVLLRRCRIDEALEIGRRLCRSVEALAIPHEARDDGIAVATISCGAAAVDPRSGVDGAELVARADQALYDAKQAGRNLCLAAGPDAGAAPLVPDQTIDVRDRGVTGTEPPQPAANDATAGLAALVAQESRRRGRSLTDQRFAPELEQRFEDDTRSEFQAHMRWCAVIGLGFFALYTLACILIPGLLGDQLIEDAVAVPLIAAFAVGVGRLKSRRLVNTLACLVIVVAASLSALVPETIDPGLAGANALTNLCFVVFANLTLRIDFDRAVVAAIAGTLVIAAMVLRPEVSAPEFVLVMTTAIGVGGLTLVANHRLIENERRAYLVSLQEHLRTEMLAADNSNLVEITTSDPLTGATNRRGFDAALAAAFGAQAKGGGAVALLMIDLDHFKSLNDLYGHPAGDACLRSVVAAIRRHLRSEQDVLARYGGEEFAVLLPQCRIDEASQIGDRLCRSVEALGIPHAARGDGVNVVTISCGAAAMEPGPGADGARLVAKADQALYRAKWDGRNRCLAADADAPIASDRSPTRRSTGRTAAPA